MIILNLDNLLNGLRRDPASLGRTGICSYNDPALEPERKGSSSVGELNRTVGVRIIIRHSSQKTCGLSSVDKCSRNFQ